MDFYSRHYRIAEMHNQVSKADYQAAGITKGMRKSDGKGILVGLTKISDAYGYDKEGKEVEGKILYRGFDLSELAQNPHGIGENVYERTAYLLLFGEWPDDTEWKLFCEELGTVRERLSHAINTMVVRENGKNIMNLLSRFVLGLYDFDDKADDISGTNILKQAVILVALMPVLSVSAYKGMKGEWENCAYDWNMCTAEIILSLLLGNNKYTNLDVEVLDTCLMLHAELGGGNNSCFTTHVVSSTGTDTYSAIASSICSIKGPRHGGANRKAFEMMQCIKSNVADWEDEKQIENVLNRILDKQLFDDSGLIYGIGHAVFTVSDPRAVILKQMAERLANQKGRFPEYKIYDKVEEIAVRLIRERKGIEKSMSANVDFYTGFIYDMLGIPPELFTPMFVNARVAGWCAHRIEEMCNTEKIIHPAFRYVGNMESDK